MNLQGLTLGLALYTATLGGLKEASSKYSPQFEKRKEYETINHPSSEVKICKECLSECCGLLCCTCKCHKELPRPYKSYERTISDELLEKTYKK
jgi:hypothetical protein